MTARGRTNGAGPRQVGRPITRATHRPDSNGADAATLITGAAGFIGSNLADRLLSAGQTVLMLDDLSRRGVERNVEWLRGRHGRAVKLRIADVRDRAALDAAAVRATRVYHFAAQTAVTTSLLDPVRDFEVNARGTLNLLEALRACEEPPPLVFTSTNKVYGALGDVPLRLSAERYEPVDGTVRETGIGEQRPIDFHSPYGCSKGAADHYVIDYARSFGLPAVVLRMSCIYGPHQLGTEDQGWVAHFLLSALTGEPLTIYGDGCQVRDLLFVDDLVDALVLAQERMAQLSGQAFNIGGGPDNTTSLLELLQLMTELGAPCGVRHGEWRTGDQRYYVSDTRRFAEATGWTPKVDVARGVERLLAWMREQPIDRGVERPAVAALASGGVASARKAR